MDAHEDDQQWEGPPPEAAVADDDLEGVSGGWPPISTPDDAAPE